MEYLLTFVTKHSIKLSKMTQMAPSVSLVGRQYCTESGAAHTEGEKLIIDVLKKRFPEANEIIVHDVSGGCGSMYDVAVESSSFKGKRTIAQHKMITKALEDEIKNMHGLRITTSVPEQ